MASESMGVGQSLPTFQDTRPPSTPKEPSTQGADQAPPKAASTDSLEKTQLNPTQVTEALADQAMEKVQKEQQDNADLSTEDLRDILDEVNNLLYSMNRALRFEIHDKTEDLVVRVVNTRTDEVIRQYPREDVIERREKLLQGELGGFSTQVE